MNQDQILAAIEGLNKYHKNSPTYGERLAKLNEQLLGSDVTTVTVAPVVCIAPETNVCNNYDKPHSAIDYQASIGKMPKMKKDGKVNKVVMRKVIKKGTRTPTALRISNNIYDTDRLTRINASKITIMNADGKIKSVLPYVPSKAKAQIKVGSDYMASGNSDAWKPIDLSGIIRPSQYIFNELSKMLAINKLSNFHTVGSVRKIGGEDVVIYTVEMREDMFTTFNSIGLNLKMFLRENNMRHLTEKVDDLVQLIKKGEGEADTTESISMFESRDLKLDKGGITDE